MSTPPLPRQVLDVAGAQHGFVVVRTVANLGVTHTHLARWEAAGWLERWHDGVYSISGMPDSWRRRVMAAVLRAGDGAVASHRTAAALHSFYDVTPGATIHITVPRTCSPTVKDATIHRSLRLPLEDLTDVDGIPATDIDRSLVDSAQRLRLQHLEAIFDDLCRRDRSSPVQVARCLRRRGKIPGKAKVWQVVTSADPQLSRAFSGPEAAGFRRIQEAGLPLPVVNLEIYAEDGWLILIFDLAWPEIMLAVEIDSRTYHRIPRDQERDRSRDDKAGDLGWAVKRIDGSLIVQRPDLFVQRVHGYLEAAGHPALVAGADPPHI